MVVGHNQSPFTNFIYSFHMPLFFVLAGFLFNYTKYSRDFGGFVRKKWHRLAVPYLVSSLVIFYPFWYLVGRHYGELAAKNFDPAVQFFGIFYASNFGLKFNGALWFVPCMFMALLLYWGIHRLSGGNRARLTVLTLVLAATGYGLSFVAELPWGLDIALVVQVFLLAGFFLRRYGFASRWWWLTVLPLAAVVVLNGRIDTATRIYHNLFLYYLGGIAGTILMMKIAQCISRWLSCSVFEHFLAYCGRNSLMILLFQMLGFKVASALLVYGCHMPLQVAKSYWPLRVVLVMASCIVVIELKKRLDMRMVRYGWWNRFFMW